MAEDTAPPPVFVEGYEINYVRRLSILDHENYNSFTGAIREVLALFKGCYEHLTHMFGTDEDRAKYQDFLTKYVSTEQQYNRGRFTARYGEPVYTWHHAELHYILSYFQEAVRHYLEVLDAIGTTVPPEEWAKVDEAKSILDNYPLLTRGSVVESTHFNLLLRVLALLHDVVSLYCPFHALVYLFNTHDWRTARKYIVRDTLMFVDFYLPTAPSYEVLTIVETYKVGVVVLIDTQPYHRHNAPAFYRIFYTLINPPACGEYLYPYEDYMIWSVFKVPGVIPWHGEDCGYGYKIYGAGGIIELPFDAIWPNDITLDSYVSLASEKIFGHRSPRRILFLGRYESTMKRGPEFYPFDNCWRALARRKGWLVIDKR